MLTPINPYTGQAMAAYPSLTPEEVIHQIGLADSAYPAWSSLSFSERADCLKRVAQELRRQKPVIAETMAREMGKPVKEGGPETEKAATCADYYASHAEEFLAREVIESDAALSYVTYQPLGVVLGILPWNAPPVAGLSLSGTRTNGGQHLRAQTRPPCTRLCQSNRRCLRGRRSTSPHRGKPAD